MLRVGAVSFLNSKPLIAGLDQTVGLSLTLDVPSKLIDGLLDGRFDVALLPVIDYQRMENLVVVPSAGIGCDGPTLTVRLFSRTPIEQTRVLACDPDSHTSVALATIILREKYRLSPELIELRQTTDSAGETRLLIGDKVVTDAPAGFAHQLDLGEAWKELTGRPFVFAVWVARKGIDLRNLPEVLTQSRLNGLANVEALIEEHAGKLGWSPTLAREYLTHFLKFEVGTEQLDAIRLFHRKAGELGLVQTPVRALEIYRRPGF